MRNGRPSFNEAAAQAEKLQDNVKDLGEDKLLGCKPNWPVSILRAASWNDRPRSTNRRANDCRPSAMTCTNRRRALQFNPELQQAPTRTRSRCRRRLPQRGRGCGVSRRRLGEVAGRSEHLDGGAAPTQPAQAAAASQITPLQEEQQQLMERLRKTQERWNCSKSWNRTRTAEKTNAFKTT